MSSSSSFPQKDDQKLKGILVAEEEKETMKNPEQGSERTITKRPSFGLGVVRPERDTMGISLSSENTYKVYNCRYCKRVFTSPFALGGHQKNHRGERMLEKLEKSRIFNRGLMKKPSFDENGSLLISLEASENLLGTSRGPLVSRGGSDKGKSISVYPSLDVRVTRGMSTMVTHGPIFTMSTRYSFPSSYQGLSSGPSYPFFNGAVMEMKPTMFPSLTRDGLVTKNASYSTSSRVPLPSYNYGSHALSNDINLELTLGPSKSVGSSNKNNINGSSFNGEVTRGTIDLNLPVLPRVSLYHSSIGNPHGSITRARDVPPSPSPAPPPRPPLQTTNLPDGMFSVEENGASYSYSRSIFDSKGKNKVMVHEDDDKGLGKIRWLTKKKRS